MSTEALNITDSTEGKLAVEHEEEEHAKSPHIDLITILLALKYLGSLVLLRS
jgi:hypothetical protein